MMSKSRLLIFSLVILVMLFLADFVFAQIELKGPPEEYEKTPLEIRYPRIAGLELTETPSLPEYIRYVYYFSIIIAGLVAFASLVYGGFRYLTSVGQPVAMAGARDQISAGVIGLVILLGSYLLLTTINPQLTIFKLVKPPSPELEIPEVKPWEVKAEEITFYEIPIGQAIERVLEKERLEAIQDLAEEIKGKSEDLKDISQDYRDKLEECNQCSNTSPSPSSCSPDNTCPTPPPVCTGDPCKDRAGVEEAKEDLKEKAEEITPLIDSALLYLIPLQQDNKLLQFASYVLQETLVPLTYSQYLAFRQMAATVGGIVKRAPFIFEGVRLLPAGDFATFYTAEEQIREIFAEIGPESFYSPYRPSPTCSQCEIDLHATNIDIPESIKEKMANMYPGGKIKASCNGIDCWDYVINWAKDNGWNPVFLLALWGEESAFSTTGVALGCIGTAGELVLKYGADIKGQLECLQQEIVTNCQGLCQKDNTDFCAFMSCYSSGPSCTLANNPEFWPDLFWFYNQILPTIPEGETPGAPSGNCALPQEKLPPGVADCPLQPGFTITAGWRDSPDACYPWGPHYGVDLSAADGDPVYAVAAGNAWTVGSDSVPCGIQIWLETGQGVFVYCHLQSTLVGDFKAVEKGELIGYANTTGTMITGPHLHFQYSEDGTKAKLRPVECLGISCIDEAPRLCPDGYTC